MTELAGSSSVTLSVTVQAVSRGMPLSRATTAVMTLVMDAMAMGVSALREYRTVPSPSTTIASVAEMFGVSPYTE